MSEEEQEKLYDLLFKDTKNKLEETIEEQKNKIASLQKEIEIWKETENDYEHELARKDEKIEKQQKEIEELSEYNDELTLIFKEKLNNIAFEVETGWRKFEKLEE